MNQQSIKAKLTEKRAQIVARIEALERDLRKEHSQDFAEQVTERENDEVIEGLLAEARREKQDLGTALARIDAGDYGVCRKCGKAIGEARLEARPEASSCINCAA